MRKCALGCVALMMLLAGAGCGAASGGGRGDCDEVDPAVVKQIMSKARTDFRPPTADGQPGVLVDHLELIASGSERLPEGSRDLGADRLVAVLVTTVFGREDASDRFGGVRDVMYFALDAAGQLLGPVGTYTNDMFDLDSPDDPEWLAWGDKAEDLKLAYGLFGCLQPD